MVNKNRLSHLIVIALLSCLALAQDFPRSKPTLTVDWIMRDPKWMGNYPGNPYWAEDGRTLYFPWNPTNDDADSLYQVSRQGGQPVKVPPAVRRQLPNRFGEYTRDYTKKVFARDGDLFLLDIKSGLTTQITNTVVAESQPRFSFSEKQVLFIADNNLYAWDRLSGVTTQRTDFRKGKAPKDKKTATDQQQYLAEEELRLIAVLRERKEKADKAKKQQEKLAPQRPKKIYLDEKEVQDIQLSPDEKFVTFVLSQRPKEPRTAGVPNYITESAFTEEISTRQKVGEPQATYEFGYWDIAGDTVLYARPDSLPGIFEAPAFTTVAAKKDTGSAAKSDTLAASKARKKARARQVRWHGPFWSDNGQHAFVVIRSQDNKDRWIAKLELPSGKLDCLDRQHDEAWIGGPNISGRGGAGEVGWMPDNRRVWFCSEQTGYSHLYTVDIFTKEKKALTRGQFEIYGPVMSRDKKKWFFSSNEAHPGERHFYSMPLEGGTRTQITTMIGNNEVALAPDEKMLAIRYSSSNAPWEIYLQENKPGAKPQRVTQSMTEEFKSYPWRVPELVAYPARDGAQVYARLYRPEQPNGAGVIFVHGAGYLQNAHKWWSSYFREYFFHNLLTDRGYTVLDPDYRASAGYGREWRTAIYRHMGGKDLEDIVDGAKFLSEQYGVEAKRLGVYGGSYGGFITLMAMFTTPEVFAAGAALRPVTDWAHYNHGYTSNILNIPPADTLAYRRSSPIYFAEGLQGALLICHGMVDVNVHFQDTVRLVQRLIELGKENWEVAIYPMEDHGFREPSSWTDEYKRILKLFEERLRD
ncbi:MAG: prolyl oligopeptidase family serine peptidase [candidate division KSB1 bacterium]|nr:prolyl oligopeptidase family serine peptidase [candidate division KSB1 bacterium]